MGKYHPKFLNRWADIYLKLMAKDKEAAKEYAARTFNPEVVQELQPVVNKKRGK